MLPLSSPCDEALWKVCQTFEPTNSNGSEHDRGERASASPSVGSSSGFRLTPSSERCSPQGAKPEKSKGCLRVEWETTFPSYSSWLVQVYHTPVSMSSVLAWGAEFLPPQTPNKGTPPSSPWINHRGLRRRKMGIPSSPGLRDREPRLDDEPGLLNAVQRQFRTSTRVGSLTKKGFSPPQATVFQSVLRRPWLEPLP